MGIRKLHEFFKKRSKELNVCFCEQKHLSDYRECRIAIDTILYLYKIKSSRKQHWVQMFLKFLLQLLEHSIYPVFVFDTQAPIEKFHKQQERRNRRENAYIRLDTLRHSFTEFKESGHIDSLLLQVSKKNEPKLLQYKSDACVNFVSEDAIVEEIRLLETQTISVSKKDVTFVQTILQALGLPYLSASTEAETLCASLALDGRVDYVLSDDTDVLVYGTPKFLTKLDMSTGRLSEFQITHVLQCLGWSLEQFRDFCILCGTDYNSNIPRVASEKAYHYMKEYPSIEELASSIPRHDYSILNYKRVREIFNIQNETWTNYEDIEVPNQQLFDTLLNDHKELKTYLEECSKILKILKKSSTTSTWVKEVSLSK